MIGWSHANPLGFGEGPDIFCSDGGSLTVPPLGIGCFHFDLQIVGNHLFNCHYNSAAFYM